MVMQRGVSVDDEQTETVVEKIKDMFNNAVGLPAGRFPDGETKPAKQTDSPQGTLTSDDAEGLPPHGGTGIAVE